MSLSTFDQTVKNYITNNPDSISYEYLSVTKTLSAWFAQNDTNGDEAVAQILNSQDIGAAHAKTCPRNAIGAATVRSVLVNSDDYPTMVSAPGLLAALDFAIGSGSVQLLTVGDVQEIASGINALLASSYSSANGSFNALKTRASSIYESLAQSDGATTDHSHINGLH